MWFSFNSLCWSHCDVVIEVISVFFKIKTYIFLKKQNKYFMPYLLITYLDPPRLSMLRVYFYITVQRDGAERPRLLRIAERHPKMSTFGTREMFIRCCSYRMGCRLKLFPIFTFSLHFLISHRKSFCFKEDGSLYLYICLYEYNKRLISILQKSKVNYTES